MKIFEFMRLSFDFSLTVLIWTVRLYIFYIMISEIKYKIHHAICMRRLRKK